MSPRYAAADFAFAAAFRRLRHFVDALPAITLFRHAAAAMIDAAMLSPLRQLRQRCLPFSPLILILFFRLLILMPLRDAVSFSCLCHIRCLRLPLLIIV